MMNQSLPTDSHQNINSSKQDSELCDNDRNNTDGCEMDIDNASRTSIVSTTSIDSKNALFISSISTGSNKDQLRSENIEVKYEDIDTLQLFDQLTEQNSVNDGDKNR